MTDYLLEKLLDLSNAEEAEGFVELIKELYSIQERHYEIKMEFANDRIIQKKFKNLNFLYDKYFPDFDMIFYYEDDDKIHGSTYFEDITRQDITKVKEHTFYIKTAEKEKSALITILGFNSK